MKTKYLIGIIVLIGGILAACEKDNYDAPNGGLYGLIIDQQTGKPVPLPVEGSTGTIIRIMEIGTKATQPVGFYAKQMDRMLIQKFLIVIILLLQPVRFKL